MAERGTGTVKWYSIAKGYGFIRCAGDDDDDDDDRDVFVHHSQVPGGDANALVEGERVSFDLVESPKGLQARNVTRVDG